MAKKSQSAAQFFGKIRNKLDKIKLEAEEINTNGITRDPSAMIKGSSPIFKTDEEARRAMENPDILFIRQYIIDKIRDILSRNNV